MFVLLLGHHRHWGDFTTIFPVFSMPLYACWGGITVSLCFTSFQFSGRIVLCVRNISRTSLSYHVEIFLYLLHLSWDLVGEYTMYILPCRVWNVYQVSPFAVNQSIWASFSLSVKQRKLSNSQVSLKKVNGALSGKTLYERSRSGD